MNEATRPADSDDADASELWRDRTFDILRGIAAYTGESIILDIARTISRYPQAQMEVAFNHKQIASKLFARDRLFDTFGGRFQTVWILGGWYGVLAAMLLNDPRFTIGRLTSIDIDPEVAPVAEELNRRHMVAGQFSAVTGDMHDLDYAGKEPVDLLINTSCEHIADVRLWLDRIPTGTKLLLQSNDYFAHSEHVNCVRSLESFRSQAALGQVIYAGQLEQKKYTRFMLIGFR